MFNHRDFYFDMSSSLVGRFTCDKTFPAKYSFGAKTDKEYVKDDVNHQLITRDYTLHKSEHREVEVCLVVIYNHNTKFS